MRSWLAPTSLPVLRLVAGLSLAACQAAPPEPTRAAREIAASSAAPRVVAAPAASAPSRFGAPLGTSPDVALSAIASAPASYVDKVVRTHGTVSAVCQAAGCWMEIKDDASEAHIRMSGHAFFVPRSSAGRRAVVEAKVLPSKTPSQCTAHCPAGADGGAACGGSGGGCMANATAGADRVELEATGVELL